jgi:hypothetical protein
MIGVGFFAFLRLTVLIEAVETDKVEEEQIE